MQPSGTGAVGVAVGPYRLVASIGRGGMADVFLAVRHGPAGFSKLIVIKRIRGDVHDDGTFRHALLTEARLAARLSHPNVVQTFEAGEDRGEIFIAMEFLDGQPLNRLLAVSQRKGVPVSVAMTVRIVSDALAGLHYAHELKDYDGRSFDIIHRDVSPQNIFLTYGGDVKVVDFGVAKAAIGEATATDMGMVKGKAAYMAPEQAKGDSLDRRVDVFAAGIILWEMLVGKRLFRGDSAVESIQKLLLAPIPPVSSVAPHVPVLVGAVADRALSRDRDGRFSTAAEMRDALERALEDSGERVPRREDLGAFVSSLFETERRDLQEQIVRITSVAQSPMSGDETMAASPRSLPKVSVTQLDSGDLVSGEGSRRQGYGDTYTPAPLTATPPPPAPTQPAPAPRSGALPRAAVAVAAVGALGLIGAVVAWRLYGKHAAETASARTDTVADAGALALAAPDLRLCGSNTIGSELAPALVEAFLKKRGASQVERSAGTGKQIFLTSTGSNGLRVSIAAEGTSTAFTGFAAGECDIGMASRAMSDDEKNTLAAKGIDDLRAPATEHVIALDGIAVIVHPGSHVRSLDKDQVQAIFTGAVTDWSKVGGKPGAIDVYARDEKSGTFDTFKNLALGSQPIAPTAKRFSESDKLSDAVAVDPNGIGFIGLAYVRTARAVSISDHGLSPSLPSPFTVATESYPLARRLYFYTLPTPKTPLAIDLVNFATSGEGQDVVAKTGFVDLSIASSSNAACDDRCPKDYAALVRAAKRLSLDFRFRQGGNELDSRATRDIDRLVFFLRAHPASRLMLLGFSDSSGQAAANVALSLDRAKSVASELEARGVKADVVSGFGSAMPVASNGDAGGRQRNRRVEVWIEGG